MTANRPRDACPDRDRHTHDPTEPRGYIAWHAWAEWMAKRTKQQQCPTCGLWAIWAPTGEALGYDPSAPRPRRRKSFAVPLGGAMSTHELILNEEITKLRAEVSRLTQERDGLLAKIEDRRMRLVRAENQLLEVRGCLSPNGQERKVPFAIEESIVPAVEWLIESVARLTQERDEARAKLDQCRANAEFWHDQQKLAANVAATIADLDEEAPALRQMLRQERARREAEEQRSLTAEADLARYRQVVEAAKAWRACTNPELVSEIDALGAVDALIAAVDALPKES